MGELPLPAIIGWLVHERCGGYDAETKLQGHLQQVLPERAVEAEEFRKILQRLPEERVRYYFAERIKALIPEAEAAIVNRESALFFHQPNALANYEFWSRAAVWSLEDAVALTLGRDPDRVNWTTIAREQQGRTEFATSYRRLAELIQRSIDAGILLQPIWPKAYLEWCKRFHLPVADGLIEAVEALEGRIIDWPVAFERVSDMYQEANQNAWAWHNSYQEEAAAHNTTIVELAAADGTVADLLEELEAAKASAASLTTRLAEAEAKAQTAEGAPLGTRERNSLLMLVFGLSLIAYRYDPKAKRLAVASELAGDMLKLGLHMSDDTVRKYIDASREMFAIETEEPVR